MQHCFADVLHYLVCMVFIVRCIIGTGHRYLVDEEENVHLFPDVEIPLKEQYHMFLHNYGITSLSVVGVTSAFCKGNFCNRHG